MIDQPEFDLETSLALATWAAQVYAGAKCKADPHQFHERNRQLEEIGGEVVQVPYQVNCPHFLYAFDQMISQEILHHC